ncbi:hypothetical protein OM076_13490 [Solirubrobacter ginsenosidimutans]|uniref:Uncharacterized protein n=1 Tax=Solirubrobacter ginsenosidimutans TaxID=490573 RepID=A0A9X3MU41_9ACTN|nr:hypothetical protein [Solirubrobacter ginsenosidimutans]MDA0161285.1 hypothetical protein [Solirubrobacter ginsenosidimutans]
MPDDGSGSEWEDLFVVGACVKAVAGIVAVALVVCVPVAGGATFADPGARVFTLVPHGSISALAELANGDVVFAVRGQHDYLGDAPGKLMRLAADGGVHVVRTDGASLLAADSPSTVLRVPEPTPGVSDVHALERVDVLTGAVTPVAALPGDWSDSLGTLGIDAVTVLDDGSDLVASRRGMFAISPAGLVQPLPNGADLTVPHGALAPLPGGRFAYVSGGQLFVGDLAGSQRLLAPGSFGGPLAASTDGGVLAMRFDCRAAGEFDEAEPVCVTLVHVGADGALTSLLTANQRPYGALGNGDGLGLFASELPIGEDEYAGAILLARDGSLLFTDDQGFEQPPTSLRALVPAASPRPRIAMSHDGFATFQRGVVGYAAGVPGAITVSVRDLETGATIDGGGQAPAPGDGALGLQSVPPPGRYRVRMRLTTTTGGGAGAVVHVDTRRMLPAREARAALEPVYEQSDGDEGGQLGTELGRCRRDAPRVVRCLLLDFNFTNALDRPEVGRWWYTAEPLGWTFATLLNDGVHTSDRGRLYGDIAPEPCLDVVTARRPHVGHAGRLNVRVTAACTPRVHVGLHLRWRTHAGKHERVLAITRTLHARQARAMAFRLPAGARAAVRAGRRVNGEIVVRAARPTRYGPVPEEQGIPFFARR